LVLGVFEVENKDAEANNMNLRSIV